MNKNLKVTVLTNGNIGYLNPTSIAIILRLQTTILCNLWSVMVTLQQVLHKTGTVWDAVSTSWISKKAFYIISLFINFTFKPCYKESGEM